MSVCLGRTVYEIFSVKEYRDLENEDGGRSGSLNMAPFDRSLYVVPFSSYLTLNNCDLKKVTEGHSNAMVPFERLGAVSYSPSRVTMAV